MDKTPAHERDAECGNCLRDGNVAGPDVEPLPCPDANGSRAEPPDIQYPSSPETGWQKWVIVCNQEKAPHRSRPAGRCLGLHRGCGSGRPSDIRSERLGCVSAGCVRASTPGSTPAMFEAKGLHALREGTRMNSGMAPLAPTTHAEEVAGAVMATMVGSPVR